MDVSGVYQRRIGGVSGRIEVVRILRYASWSIECVSHVNRTRIGYVSDTGYNWVLKNPGNIAH
jgi:hypothetical protein